MLQDLKKGPVKKSRGEGPGKERRGEPRYPLTAMAEAIEIKSHTRVTGRISDIGAGGCYFEVMSPFAVGADLQLRITRDNQTLTASAKVLYSTGGMGMGLLFTKVDPGQSPILRKWVGDLSGKTVAPSGPDGSAAGSSGEGVPASGASAPENSGSELVYESPGAAERAGMNEDPRNVLSELVTLLMRNRVLTDTEGKNLLRKLTS